MKISVVRVEMVRQNELLERIADALERIAGPLPPPTPVKTDLYRATERDLRRVSPMDISRRRAAVRDICTANLVQPFTPAGDKLLAEIEAMTLAEGGPDAVAALPWNA